MTDGLSLFFPMYNEEGNVERAVGSALAVLPRIAAHYEVIVVDDGSRDRTGAIADRLAIEHAQVRVVHHQGNRGYGAALRSGFAAAQYPLVAFVDGDNQFDLNELPLLIDALDGHDVVSGYRIKRRDPAIRRLNAFIYNTSARILFRIGVRDVNCAFKIYRRPLVQTLLPDLQTTGALINSEMLARARRKGASIGEVGVHHYARETGAQTGGSIAVILRAFREMLVLWRELQ